MNKRIISVILASIMVAGMTGIVATADNEAGDNTPVISETTTKVVEILTSETTEEETETTAYTTVANTEPETPARAQSIVFESGSGYLTYSATGYLAGVEAGKTAGDVLGALKNRNGIEMRRGDAVLAETDVLVSDDAIVLTDDAGVVKSKFYVIIMGDAGRDGSVSLSDVTAVLKEIAGWNISIDMAAADVDGSGAVNISDVTFMLKKIAGWNVKFTSKPLLPGSGIINTFAESVQGNINLRKGQDLAVKFTVEEGYHARSASAVYPSWGDSKGSLRLSVYKWDTDYATTVAAEPIATREYKNFNDCTAIEFSFADKNGELLPAGDYIWRIHEGYDERVNPNDENEPVGVGMFTFACPAADSGLTVFYEGVALDPAAADSFGPHAQINICK